MKDNYNDKVRVLDLSVLPNYSILKMFKQDLDGRIDLMSNLMYPYKIDEIINRFEDYEEFVTDSFHIREDISDELYNNAINSAKNDIKAIDDYLKKNGHQSGELVIFKQG